MHYVIGDVHGQLDALRLLLEKIKYNPAVDYLYFVGDYVDWGDKSIGTLLYVMELSKNPNVKCVLGNHDKMMLDSITNVRYKRQIENRRGLWALNGGLFTYYYFCEQPVEIQQMIIEWLKALPKEIDGICLGDKKFCVSHATRVVPACRREWTTEDSDSERVWHRMQPGEDPFCGVDDFSGTTLICGHTITMFYTGKFEPFFDEKFIDIDTGAKVLGVRDYEGANLTALKLEDLSYVSVK